MLFRKTFLTVTHSLQLNIQLIDHKPRNILPMGFEDYIPKTFDVFALWGRRKEVILVPERSAVPIPLTFSLPVSQFSLISLRFPVKVSIKNM